jgi:hypothetical protein
MIISKLLFGSTFLLNHNIFILTQDRNRLDQRNCINIKTGSSQWIDDSIDVEIVPLYTLDKNNNFMPLKEDNNYELVTN